MKYFGLIIALISLILFMFVALVLVYSSDSIGLSVMIGAIIVFTVGQFLELVEIIQHHVNETESTHR